MKKRPRIITVGYHEQKTYHHSWSNLEAVSTNRWTTRTPRRRMLRRRHWSEWERSTDALWTYFRRDWCFITVWRTSYLESWRRFARCCSAFTARPAGTITASSRRSVFIHKREKTGTKENNSLSFALLSLSFFPYATVTLKSDLVLNSRHVLNSCFFIFF